MRKLTILTYEPLDLTLRQWYGTLNLGGGTDEKNMRQSSGIRGKRVLEGKGAKSRGINTVA